MRDRVAAFLCLSPGEQIQFLKSGDFTKFSREDKIDFLKILLNSDASSKTIASALKLLRELKYRDKFFFRKFLYHIDSSVANAAKKAVEDSVTRADSGAIRISDLVRKERGENRIMAVRSLLTNKEALTENVLISLLNIDDYRVRETVVNTISSDYHFEDSLLADGVRGSVWYVRASLVEILGKRKSKYIYELADSLIKDSNVEVRLKLITALENLQQESSRPFLEQLKKDPVSWIRKEAERALSRLQF